MIGNRESEARHRARPEPGTENQPDVTMRMSAHD